MIEPMFERHRCHRALLLVCICLVVCAWSPSQADCAPHIGYVYKLEGHLNGQPVRYIGSAASLKERLVAKHEWSQLLRQTTTKVSFKKVYAELNITASKKKHPSGARSEALRSVEQLELDKAKKQAEAENRKKRPGQKRTRILNSRNMATDPHILQKRHNVTSSRRWGVLRKPGAPLILRSVGGVLLIAEVIRLYYDHKRSRFVMAPYLLEDEYGVFTLDYAKSSWLARTKYFKNYVVGVKQDTRVQVSKIEFSALTAEAKALWGTVDGRGNFVPGLLRPSLDVIVKRA